MNPRQGGCGTRSTPLPLFLSTHLDAIISRKTMQRNTLWAAGGIDDEGNTQVEASTREDLCVSEAERGDDGVRGICE